MTSVCFSLLSLEALLKILKTIDVEEKCRYFIAGYTDKNNMTVFRKYERQER